MKTSCEWKMSPNAPAEWQSECGGPDLYLPAGTPSELEMDYCCFCGKRLVEVKA